MIDIVVEKWKKNYVYSIQNQLFSKNNCRPLSLILKTHKYAGLPFVLVAAGPSLDKNIGVLKEYASRCIIVCADVVLFKLLEHGIKPDFLVSIDPDELIWHYTQDLDTTEITFIAPTTVYPKAIEAWKGNVAFFNQEDIPKSSKQQLLKNLTGPTSQYTSILNRFFVGATAFQISCLLGASSCIFVGYDFAHTDNKPYCEGVLERKLGPALEILRPDECKVDRIYKIKDEEIPTTKLLLFYKKTLLDLIRKARKPIINCTEGGIMREIPCAPLDQILVKVCTKEIPRVDLFKIESRRRKRK